MSDTCQTKCQPHLKVTQFKLAGSRIDEANAVVNALDVLLLTGVSPTLVTRVNYKP